ncbi:MAG: 3-deoxy-D-manno-octulosonic acid transferase, partial [Chitinophagaceae bacterium]
EIDTPHLKTLQEKFPEAVLYSRAEKNTNLSHATVLIIDAMGMLSKLYKYATVCYIGGGFNRSGIHNILEAAVYGKPIFSAPEHSKYREAIALKEAGAYFPVKDGKKLSNAIDATDIAAAGSIAAHYVEKNSGATAVIGDWIQENRLLTNA